MSCEERPELSVVVPVFNEGANLALFLRELSLQRDVSFELIVSDGGSTDGSLDTIPELSGSLPFPVSVVHGAKGRGRQLNLGAGAARAATILFLHADSRFPDPLSFRSALDLLRLTSSRKPRVAGHFSLQFHFDAPLPLPYRYYAAKATLDRTGCTHGDQGLMIDATFFREIGPFDATLPLMEDTSLAERIRESGSWLLFPSVIVTSPRRFLTEGLLPRQTLNAILMNLAAIGHVELIDALRESYRSQDAARRLRLAPFFAILRERIAALPPIERRALWYKTGSYVRGNAWQIPFFLDVMSGDCAAGRGGRFVAFHDRFVRRVIDNAAGDWMAAALVWVWFRVAGRS